MLSRSAVGRQAQRAVRQSHAQSVRGYAAASAPFQYQAGEAAGIKIASRDIPGPVATLAIVANAGTRYQFLPGLAEGLQRYAFKATENRSALRIQREAELLGSELQSSLSRENLTIGAKFLRDDLPYFLELLAEVATQTKFQPHVVDEEIIPLLQLTLKKHLADTLSLAQDSVHGLAFHRGLGNPLHITSTTPLKKYVDVETLSAYAASAFAKPSFAIVANGADQTELSKWVGEFFTDVPAQPQEALTSEQTKYYGGEERISHGSAKSSFVVGLPGSSSATGSFFKPEAAVLATLLGGQSSIKWASGFSLLAKATESTPTLNVATTTNVYGDAGLVAVSLSGAAKDVRSGASKIAESLKAIAQGVDQETFQKAKALAKFNELERGSETAAGIRLTGAGLLRDGKPYQINDVASALDGVTEDQLKQFAKEALENKASVSAVGDLHVLPYAEEIGLKV